MKNKESLLTFTWIAFGIIIVWIGCWILTDLFILSSTERGTFGDNFSSVNALFYGLALAGVIYALLLQRTDLEIQRKSLDISINEAKEQRDLARSQQFENTFFNLLSFGMNSLQDVQIKYSDIESFSVGVIVGTPEVIKGREVFRSLRNHFSGTFGNEQKVFNFYENEKEAALNFFRLFESKLSIYLYSTYQLLAFVQKANAENKLFYVRLLRSQLTDDEAYIFLLYLKFKKGDGEMQQFCQINDFDANSRSA